jgi:hypothetical protein
LRLWFVRLTGEYLVEVAAQRVHQFGDLTALLFGEVHVSERLSQFVDHLSGDPRKVIDEIERVLDLVRDACGELTE